MVEERRARSGVRAVPTGAEPARQGRGGWPGQPQCQGAPGRHGCSTKNAPKAMGKSRSGWNNRIHGVATDARTAVAFPLSPGNAPNAPEGRKLLDRISQPCHRPALIMDRDTGTTKPGNQYSLWVLFPSSRRKAAASIPGRTTGNRRTPKRNRATPLTPRLASGEARRHFPWLPGLRTRRRCSTIV